MTATPAQHQRPRARARRLLLGQRRRGRLRPRAGGDRLGHRRLGRGSRPPGTTSSASRPRTASCRSTACVPLRPAFDTVGPLTRSVEDAALLLAALGGPAVDLAGAGARAAPRSSSLEDPAAPPDPRRARRRPSRRRSPGSPPPAPASTAARSPPSPRRWRSAPTVAARRGLRRLARDDRGPTPT